MHAGPRHTGPRDRQSIHRAAEDCPLGAVPARFADLALPLFENGFEPLPILPGTKKVVLSRWTAIPIEDPIVESWSKKYQGFGVGLRTGHLVGLDIDQLDPDRAHEIHQLARQRFGETLMRVGLWPKRLLLYRTDTPFPKMSSDKIEVLGLGQQFVAFGRHPDTGRDYYWPGGETPLDVSLGDLPQIDEADVTAFLAEAVPASGGASQPGRSPSRGRPGVGDKPVRDASNMVIDGRDGWLSRIAYHAVHDAIDRGDALDIELIAELVWKRFAASTDLSRPCGNGCPYGLVHARAKVADKLRLARDGRLPPRDRDTPEPGYAIPTVTAAEGREALRARLTRFCGEVLGWHCRETLDLPRLGVRATVGLGKTAISRDLMLKLATDLRADNLPSRILVFTPSHALAEETAAAWRAAGIRAAVARGYERKDPITGTPLCRDIAGVRAALAARLEIRTSVCKTRSGQRCRHFHGCLKQRNLDDVAAADVVVAPYDALFTGLAFEKDDIALLLIDEGCWARALTEDTSLTVEDLATEPLSGMGSPGRGRGPTGAMADLHAFRLRLVKALDAPGPVTRKALSGAGLTAKDCEAAARLERWRQTDPKLHPGQSAADREVSRAICYEKDRIERLAGLWTALQRFLAGTSAVAANVSVVEDSGQRYIDYRGVRRLHESLRGKPVLHLDATLRPDLAATVLPGMAVETIDVAAPHMHVRQVSGSFGKSMLCPSSGLSPAECQRRANRLQECVDHVRWHARRVHPGRVLVVTYKAVEEAFEGIPNVETAHFNAVAGLDGYKDVALIVVIGRPLPSHEDVGRQTGAYFQHVARGQYHPARAGIQMRSGQMRSLPVIRQDDEKADILRAAICDDELVQVVGRGRGVNRTASTPLDVHVLANVALPLVYDSLTTWDIERPDILQRMLLAGVAVDSPGDAAALQPALFGNAHQAKMVFERGLFKAQNPIRNIHREMCLKSAAYRRPGRGRGWQRAWWLDGDADGARRRLEAVLGALADWCPD